MKRLTIKSINQAHPDFEVTRRPTNSGLGGVDVKHIPTGKEVVCILGKRLGPIENFLNDVEKNPEQLNNKSYFRHVQPTSENPYEKEDGSQVEVKVTATEQELMNHFGKPGFTFPGETLTVRGASWSSLNEQWQPGFEQHTGPGGFWLHPSMVEIVK